MALQRVLFLCTHNSARSQMAEGWLRNMAPDRFEAQSAGTERRSIHPLAIRAMAERGIDISGHTSKLLMGFMQEPWDYVITVCADANEDVRFSPGRSSGCIGPSRTPHGRQEAMRSASTPSELSATTSRRACASGLGQTA